MIEPYACAGMQNLHVNAEFAEQAHRTPPPAALRRNGHRHAPVN
jgi:hypothetical protein